MLVVAIIALLLSTGFYYLRPQIEIGPDAKIGADFRAFDTALQTYENLDGSPADHRTGIAGAGDDAGDRPEAERWYQLMERLPKDPWGHDYVYVCPGKHNPQGYDLYSKGKDRIADTADDKGNWDDSSRRGCSRFAVGSGGRFRRTAR